MQLFLDKPLGNLILLWQEPFWLVLLHKSGVTYVTYVMYFTYFIYLTYSMHVTYVIYVMYVMYVTYGDFHPDGE